MAFENLIAIQYSTNKFKLSIHNNIHADDKKSDFLELFSNVIPIWEKGQSRHFKHFFIPRLPVYNSYR